jgi:SOS-response transcriptional repressor LexA
MSWSQLFPGDTILVKPVGAFTDGDTLLVRLRPFGRQLVGKLYCGNGIARLVPVSGHARPLRLPEHSVEVLGVVVAVARWQAADDHGAEAA